MPTFREPIGLKNGKHLDDLEHKSIEENEYKPKLKEAQLRLLNLQRELSETKRSLIIVFEGPDAAGKGGAIKRATERLDPRLLRVHSVVKPTEEEHQRHYLWRFWTKIPKHGHTVIFDRSWYGRVLVERIEGFCRENEWRRAFGEISDFERQLTEHGIIVLKFWLQISKEEQLRRFRDRENTEYKNHKINAEDWRNRRQWRAYEAAVGDMLASTGNRTVPWHLVPANNKRFARLQIIKTSCQEISAALEG